MRKLDLAGQKFGRLTLVRVVGVNKSKQRVWLCLCDCGKQHTAAQAHITGGKVTSCGCYRRERATKHGMHLSDEWRAFGHAKTRCKSNHKHHAHYFDRGILFKFESFEQFYAEIGPKPTAAHQLDRIDNDKGYEPGNVRWATKSQNERNRRCDNCAALKARIKELELQISTNSNADRTPRS
jgi:hypothetical protein